MHSDISRVESYAGRSSGIVTTILNKAFVNWGDSSELSKNFHFLKEPTVGLRIARDQHRLCFGGAASWILIRQDLRCFEHFFAQPRSRCTTWQARFGL